MENIELHWQVAEVKPAADALLIKYSVYDTITGESIATHTFSLQQVPRHTTTKFIEDFITKEVRGHYVQVRFLGMSGITPPFSEAEIEAGLHKSKKKKEDVDA